MPVSVSGSAQLASARSDGPLRREDGLPFIAMEFAERGPLDSVLKKRRLAPGRRHTMHEERPTIHSLEK